VTGTRGGRGGAPPWAGYSDEELLDLRFADLEIVSPGVFLEPCLEQTFTELAQRGIRFCPRVWVSDEWFSPDGIGGFAVPFYLTHPRLRRLEKRMMYAVEGGTRRECLKLVRHETAHALQHAYHFGRRRNWRRTFGRSSRRYPDRYRPDPASRDYVHHLPDWYAQCHPDEDFAETFSVWLPRRSRWRDGYLGWPALTKLEYVDRLMGEVSSHPVPRVSRRAIDPVHRLQTTLREHYRERRERFGVDRTTPLDAPLRSFFKAGRVAGDRQRGAALLRRIRAKVEAGVAPRSVEAEYALAMVYDDLIGRSEVLALRTAQEDQAVVPGVVRFVRRHLRALLNDPSAREWIPV
jgi:hypothetical protein